MHRQHRLPAAVSATHSFSARLTGAKRAHLFFLVFGAAGTRRALLVRSRGRVCRAAGGHLPLLRRFFAARGAPHTGARRASGVCGPCRSHAGLQRSTPQYARRGSCASPSDRLRSVHDGLSPARGQTRPADHVAPRGRDSASIARRPRPNAPLLLESAHSCGALPCRSDSLVVFFRLFVPSGGGVQPLAVGSASLRWQLRLLCGVACATARATGVGAFDHGPLC
mmetsp:Transcript_5972/g.15154  ORF Transcript_5972/g.15154 Transcript_5972/m.15154 type:complete len:224 (-) Transcript_5972:142-813(-)